MREVSRHLFIPRRPLIASMLSCGPERSWFRIVKASLISSTRPALTSVSAPFRMTRRLPLPARRTFASIDRTTGSRSGHWPLSPTCSAAAIFARLSWISIRSAAMVIRSTISWTRLFSSTGGIASHRSESLRALCRAASSAYASRPSGASVSLTSVLDDKTTLSAGRAPAPQYPPPTRATLHRPKAAQRHSSSIAWPSLWHGSASSDCRQNRRSGPPTGSAPPRPPPTSARADWRGACPARSAKAPDRGGPLAGRGRLCLGEQCRPDRSGSAASDRGPRGKNVGRRPAVRRLLHGACSQYPVDRVRPRQPYGRRLRLIYDQFAVLDV